MPLISMPASLSKGSSHTITLDKDALFALPVVSADSYFSIQSNASRCIVEYNSNPGDQKHYLIFDLSQASPSAIFTTSEHARGSFLLERIVIEDFDEGTLVIERPNLPVGYDVTLI